MMDGSTTVGNIPAAWSRRPEGDTGHRLTAERRPDLAWRGLRDPVIMKAELAPAFPAPAGTRTYNFP